MSAGFTSLPRALDMGCESHYIDTQDVQKLLDCGRLGRQAADHPRSALWVVKATEKDCPTASVLLKPKQQLCIRNGTRAHYLNYLQRGQGGAEEKKRRQSDWPANQIDRESDRQVEDRQTGRNRPMRAGHQADRAASYIATLGRCDGG